MSASSARQFRSSRSLWQDTIFELCSAGTLLPEGNGSEVDAALATLHDLETSRNGAPLQEMTSRGVSSSVKLALSALDTFSHVLTGIDRLTHAHSERVARHAMRLAHLAGVHTDDLKRLQLGALLHDCGKIYIDDAILNKAGALTEYAYSQVKTHPLHGVRILRSVPALRAAIPTVLHHHERFDGTGYPARLQREEIPLTARIVCIADAYDAMISDRPYRRGLSHAHARETLCACRGAQFDPELVDLFVHSLDSTAKALP